MGACWSALCGRSKYNTLVEAWYDPTHMHQTYAYRSKILVVRRGYQFKLDLPVINADKLKSDKISLKLTVYGVDRQSFIVYGENKDFQYNYWKFDVLNSDTDGGCLSISIHPPADAPVGKYKVSAYYSKENIGHAQFIMIFNPFCKDDDVYMPNSSDIKEYIMNESTIIYMGTEDNIMEKEWDLGQFEEYSVMSAVELLNRMPMPSRKSAVEVSRNLSAMINSNDDNGVLMGNWSGKYYDGTNPMSWTGSTEILRSFYRSGRPVRYGQCWVFSGVLCTVLRTLGIPSRIVTNYSSLHDTDGSLKWEIYLDANFNPINNAGDSCWNFHCWDEAWMARPDLGPDHDGWQVVDATPQERSGGLFRLGPASKYAVRNALLKAPYDVGFVYAEVNADKVFFLQGPDGTFKEYMVKKNELGRMVITKAKLSTAHENITLEYKCTDAVMDSVIDDNHGLMRANERSRRRNIKINVTCPGSIYLTDGLKGIVSIIANSHVLCGKVKIEVDLVSYNGKLIQKLYEASDKITSTENSINFFIEGKNMSSAMLEQFPFIKINVFCLDSNSDELGYSEKIVSFKTPEIEIFGVPPVCNTGEKFVSTIKIRNTLNRPLTKGKLFIKMSDSGPVIKELSPIGPGEEFVYDMAFTTNSPGDKKITAVVECIESCSFSRTSRFTAQGSA